MENSIKRFFQEHAEITNNPNDKVSTNDLKYHYAIFCHNQKIRAVGANKLTAVIRNEIIEIQYVQYKPKGTNTVLRRWQFVKIPKI